MHRFSSLSSRAILYRQIVGSTASALQYSIPKTPFIEAYPTCNPTVQPYSTNMSDLGVTSNNTAEEVNIIVPTSEQSKEKTEQQPSSKTATSESTMAEPEKKLPPLSPAEFKVYNMMAENMEYFHNYFRSTWNTLYNACQNNERPRNMSIKQFISTGLQFCSHLTGHHTIEEQHVFPILARRMPEFKNGPKYKGAAELLRQHKAIHDGLDVFELYLRQCQTGEADFNLRVVKTKMDSFGEVLWTHLDQEVKTLGAENMRLYWTMEEMRRMPM